MQQGWRQKKLDVSETASFRKKCHLLRTLIVGSRVLQSARHRLDWEGSMFVGGMETIGPKTSVEGVTPKLSLS